MISRLWHGWTTPGNADGYEGLIRSTIFPGILGRKIEGLRRLELHRRPLGDEVEFVTVMWFASLGRGESLRGAGLGSVRRAARRQGRARALRRQGAALRGPCGRAGLTAAEPVAKTARGKPPRRCRRTRAEGAYALLAMISSAMLRGTGS